VRGATGRSGELGLLRERAAAGEARQLQNIVSLSALYDLLTSAGYSVGSPHELALLEGRARQIVTTWIESAAQALEDAFVAVNCLLNPEAVLIGGRLPAALVDRLAARLNERLATHRATIPAIAPVARAAMSDDAPAVGAAILPFSERFLPTRFALMKSAS
jgi:predicted NBD/HSP70 family sugar kinase